MQVRLSGFQRCAARIRLIWAAEAGVRVRHATARQLSRAASLRNRRRARDGARQAGCCAPRFAGSRRGRAHPHALAAVHPLRRTLWSDPVRDPQGAGVALRSVHGRDRVLVPRALLARRRGGCPAAPRGRCVTARTLRGSQPQLLTTPGSPSRRRLPRALLRVAAGQADGELRPQGPRRAPLQPQRPPAQRGRGAYMPRCPAARAAVDRRRWGGSSSAASR